MKKYTFNSILATILIISATAFTTKTKAGLPDLKIESAKVVCEKQRWLVFEVSNIGTEESEPTIIRIRPENNDDPTQRCIAKAVEHVPILQPGKIFKMRVPLKDSDGCKCKDPLKFELKIDYKNYVEESDENNNTFMLRL